MGTLKNLSEELHPQVLRMYAAGIGVSRIGLLLGVYSHQVQKFLRDEGKMRSFKDSHKNKSTRVGMNKQNACDFKIENATRVENLKKLEVISHG